jgi:hypothetical protein
MGWHVGLLCSAAAAMSSFGGLIPRRLGREPRVASFGDWLRPTRGVLCHLARSDGGPRAASGATERHGSYLPHRSRDRSACYGGAPAGLTQPTSASAGVPREGRRDRRHGLSLDVRRVLGPGRPRQGRIGPLTVAFCSCLPAWPNSKPGSPRSRLSERTTGPCWPPSTRSARTNASTPSSYASSLTDSASSPTASASSPTASATRTRESDRSKRIWLRSGALDRPD